MILTEQQIGYISTNLEFYGIASEDLRNDMLDHICTYIEEGNFADFDTAYASAIAKFGGYAGMGSLQRETTLQVSVPKYLKRKKVFFITGFVASTLATIGFLFKVMHWPGASIMLILGLATFIFAVIPLWFYQKYKSEERKIYNR